MEVLRLDEIAQARATCEGDKLRQALELMSLGLELQRRKLQAADPAADAALIAERLSAWMSAPR